MRRTSLIVAGLLPLLLSGCPLEPYDPAKVDPADPATGPGSGAVSDGPAGASAPVDPPAEVAGVPVEVPETLSSGEGGTTPEDAFFRMKAAVEARDFGVYYDLLTPDARRSLLPMISLAAGLVATTDPGATQELEALFARYDLTEASQAGPAAPGDGEPGADGEAAPGIDVQAMAQQFDGVEDPRALFAELMAFVAARQPPQDVSGLEDLTVDGDVGRANKVIEGEDGRRFREPIAFRRIAARWYVHVDAGQ